MSLTNAIAQQTAGMSDIGLRRDIQNMERDLKLRNYQYAMQKQASEQKAAIASGLIGSTLGLAKGAYGAYQDHEHKNAVKKSLEARSSFPKGPKGDRAFYDSVRNRQGPGVLEDVYFRQHMPQAGNVEEYLQRQGLLSEAPEQPSWMDDFADIANSFPSWS